MANNSKIHIKHEQLEQGITVNVFGDSAEEAIELLIATMAEVQGIAQKVLVRSAYQQHPTTQAAPPSPPVQAPMRQPRGNGGSGTINRPVCKQCGSSDHLDEVQFTNQDTGQLMTRFKCQTCRIWVGKAF